MEYYRNILLLEQFIDENQCENFGDDKSEMVLYVYECIVYGEFNIQFIIL
jgi:hypothetical protein